jgi:hypothetical protein
MVAITKVLGLVLTAATATTASAIVRRDAISIESDITDDIGPSWTSLSNDVKVFPASGADGAAAIQEDLEDFVEILETATSYVKSNGKVAVVDAINIIADIQIFEPILITALVTLKAQVAAWRAVQGGEAEILSQLQEAKTAVSDYLDAIIAIVPLLQKAAVVTIKTKLSIAFTAAIAVYSV